VVADPDLDPPSADEDDDWPTRYSWLDDEQGETPHQANESGTPVNPAADTDDRPVPKASMPAGSGRDEAQDAPAGGAPAIVSAPPTVSGPAFDPEPATVPAPPTVPAPAFDPEPEPVPADDEPPAADAPGAAEADELVAVLHGVPRYHQPDCVLIRFLPDDGIQRLSVTQAKANGCTPCAACQPAQE
jgi:hypothetical protein